MLSADLLERLRARASSPATRTDRCDHPGGRSHFGGAFETRVIGIDGSSPPDPPQLPRPADDDAVQSAERRLGFSLPADLVNLYLSIANGGFGPGAGLAPLDQIVVRYSELCAAPPGEEGEVWPEHLLPVTLTTPGADCYDVQTGEIVFWDEEVLAEGHGADVWARSFRVVADNLAFWLEAWVSASPPAAQLDRQIEDGMRENMRQTLAHWRAMTPEQRAEFGLSEEGWEEELFGHLGIDLKGL